MKASRLHWVPRKLDQLGFVGRGKSRHRPRNDPALYGGPHLLVLTADIMASEFYITRHSRTYSEMGLSQSKLWDKGTLCLTIAGENTGESGILGMRACFPDSVVGFIADPKQADVRFVKYSLDLLKPAIRNITRGATQDNLSLDKLLSFDILTPPLRTQQKIASILSAYEDLIENNTRRIRILEEMAQTIYREWFVHFGFPGHQNICMVDSPAGKIPQGWEAVRYDELLESFRGGDWGEDEPTADERTAASVIRGTDLDDFRQGTTLRVPHRFIAASSMEKRQLQENDLIVENSVNAKSRCIGTTLLITPGMLRRLGSKAIAASFCKVFRFKDPRLAPLSHLHIQHLRAEGRMAFYQNVATNGIGNFAALRFVESEFLILPKDMARRADLLTVLGDFASSTLADQIFALRKARDFLLPKLISGEVDVSELDVETASEVAV